MWTLRSSTAAGKSSTIQAKGRQEVEKKLSYRFFFSNENMFGFNFKVLFCSSDSEASHQDTEIEKVGLMRAEPIKHKS